MTISTRHKWPKKGDERPYQFKTERDCSRCGVVKVTRHDDPHGWPWPEFWRDGEQIRCEATPPCDARLERKTADNLAATA